MFNALEGDGVIDNIYHFLWTKDTIFHTDPSIYIPHTILYKYNKPCYWYFTSVVDHKLKKKNPGNLNPEHIKHVFLKNVSESGIVCYFIYEKINILSKYESDKPTFEKIMKKILGNSDTNEKEENKSSNIKFNNRVKSSYSYKSKIKRDEYKTNNNKKYIIEYYNKKQFIDFLNNKIRHEEGILQKFIDPKGEYNTTYRLIWSPKLSLFEKCTNLKKLNDKHYDIYERVVTYDGEQFQTKIEPLKGSHLPERIQNIAIKIAEHVSNITLEKIKIVRMILNFKVDKRDRIVFLWCSSLRIDNGPKKKFTNNRESKSFLDKVNSIKIKNEETRIKSVDESKIKLNPPDNINIFKYSILGKPIQPHKEAYCLNCGLNVENYKLYEISYKNLIEGHENLKRDKQFFPLYNNINMTSTGIEVLSSEERKRNDKKNNVIQKLRDNNYYNFVIPKVIAQLYPKLSYNDYYELKKDIIFLNKKTYICDTCYLEITKYCSMAGSNNEYLLRTVKKDDFNFYLNNSNSSYNRPKSANRFIYSKTDNYNDRFLTANNDNLLTSFSQKKQKNTYNNKNLYQNYISNLAMYKNEEKKMKIFAVPSFDEDDNVNKNKGKFYIGNKFNKKNIPNIKMGQTFNETIRLNSEANKKINNSLVKNRIKNHKLFPNINTFTYNSKMFEKEDTNSFYSVRGPFPLKIKKLNLNSTSPESLKDNKIKNYLDKTDFEYFN